jgi:hypothetical protein
MFVSLYDAPIRVRSVRKTRRLAKTKIGGVEDGLKNAAVAVGSALGILAQKVGLAKAVAVVAPKAKKKAAKKAVVHKSPAAKKKTAPTKKAASKKKVVAKKVAAKKVAIKRTAPKKAKGPAKKK